MGNQRSFTMVGLRVLCIMGLVASSRAWAENPSDVTEAQRIYQSAQRALSVGDFELAKKDYETLNRKYPQLIADEDDADGSPITFAKVASSELKRIACLMKYETAEKSPARNSNDTLNQLIAAIASKDRPKLDLLVSCEVAEGEAGRDESDSSTHEKIIQHLLDRMASKATYKPVGKSSNGFQIISDGTTFVQFKIVALPWASKTTRLSWVLWGKP